jgi:hypothetical protein
MGGGGLGGVGCVGPLLMDLHPASIILLGISALRALLPGAALSLRRDRAGVVRWRGVATLY